MPPLEQPAMDRAARQASSPRVRRRMGAVPGPRCRGTGGIGPSTREAEVRGANSARLPLVWGADAELVGCVACAGLVVSPGQGGAPAKIEARGPPRVVRHST